MKKLFLLLVLLSACQIPQSFDTLEKGDKVWILDSEDTGFGRIAEVATDWFGKDYFGNNSWCFIKYPESGNGMRGVMLSSIYKIHNCDELVHYKLLEQKKLARDAEEQKKADKYIIYDTLHKDYYSARGWSIEKSKAKVFTKAAADKWLKNFRENEDGEYSNSGEDNYPVVIQKLNKTIN